MATAPRMGMVSGPLHAHTAPHAAFLDPRDIKDVRCVRAPRYASQIEQSIKRNERRVTYHCRQANFVAARRTLHCKRSHPSEYAGSTPP